MIDIKQTLGGYVPLDPLLRAAIYIAKIRDSDPRDHRYRLENAKVLAEIIENFIGEEARAAVSENKNDSAHLSWHGVAETLGKSKTAIYTRYGGNK